ncbi:antirestriction protein ArdA [Caballeronia sp. BCC1704]|uniref:antirestriction protein ArdA n=1 Tax=Caballeronia sp. BCC1704 TaxID=2676300 RepID=UPI00158F51E8|nr:antirestriction protein ArdA [Caballeronia sp. BCC1704]
MANFFANPYGPATGFFFSSAEELEAKTKHWRDHYGAVVEEWSVEFIDGSAGEPELFAAAGIDAGNINLWFDELEDLEESQRAALFFMLSKLGCKLSDALEKLEDAIVSEASLKDAAAERFDETWLPQIPERTRAEIAAYIDYEAYARDQELNGELSEFDFAGKTWTCLNPDAL